MIRKLDHRTIAFAVVCSSVVAADQYTKVLVRRYLPLNASWNPIPWLDRIVTLTRVHNTGAAFGLFPNMSIVFVIVALVVIGCIVAYHRRLAQASWVLRLALGLQLGGATGNLIDRLVRGYVTDFIDLRVWPVFNVADSSLVVGTAMVAYYALFMDRAQEDIQSSEGEPEALDANGC